MLKIKSYEARPRKNDGSKKYFSPTKIYIFPEGESIFENLENRRSRPSTTYKKEVLPLLLEDVKKEGLNLDGKKISWSQKAGCSCGCSPGFIINRHYGYDVYVTIVEEA